MFQLNFTTHISDNVLSLKVNPETLTKYGVTIIYKNNLDIPMGCGFEYFLEYNR